MSSSGDLPRRLGDILSPALDRIAGGEEARAYAAWARAVGEPVSRGARPKAFRRGQLTVECASSVWANELMYLGPQILRRMDEVAPGHPVKRFRFIVGRLPDRAPQAASSQSGEAGPEDPARPSTDPPAGTAPDAPDGALPAAAGQGSGHPAAKNNRRDQPPAADPDQVARAEVEGVQDGRLRAAIEASLRRASEEPPEALADGTPPG